MYKFVGKPGKMYSLDSETTTIKLNYNCPDSEKVGSGPGSCGGTKDNIKEKSIKTSKVVPLATRFSDDLNDKEISALESYSTDSYSYISSFLNAGDTSNASGSTFTSGNKELSSIASYIEKLNFNEDKIKGNIYYIDNAMKKSKTKSSGVVYSGLGKEKNAQFLNLKIGETTTFKGYTSASKKLNITGLFIPRFLEKNIVLKINVPKGTNAIDMEKFASTENRKQYEVLLHKGITYKKVSEKSGNISAKGKKIPITVVEVTIVNPVDDSPRIDWEPDIKTPKQHVQEYKEAWKFAHDSVTKGAKSITIPEEMADPFRRFNMRTVSIGDEITFNPDFYSKSTISKITSFEPITTKASNDQINYSVAARTASGNLVDLSNHKGIK
jgi:hypothetical protein